MGRAMKKNWLLWMPLALLAFVAGLSLYRLSEPENGYKPTQMVGQKLPEFALSPAVAEGQGLSSKDFADGKPRLLNIFASWCAPCKAEAPYLEQLKVKGAVIHGIAVRDKPQDLETFLKEHGNPFSRIGADPDMLIQVKLGSTGVPETYIIDGKGRIAYHHIGDIREEHVPMLLEKLVKAK
jgi:cytochrome c biogenesis protein CcmG, thiol:disulfide interchange protein DsbE